MCRTYSPSHSSVVQHHHLVAGARQRLLGVEVIRHCSAARLRCFGVIHFRAQQFLGYAALPVRVRQQLAHCLASSYEKVEGAFQNHNFYHTFKPTSAQNVEGAFQNHSFYYTFKSRLVKIWLEFLGVFNLAYVVYRLRPGQLVSDFRFQISCFRCQNPDFSADFGFMVGQ